jgi:hypothetical protein
VARKKECSSSPGEMGPLSVGVAEVNWVGRGVMLEGRSWVPYVFCVKPVFRRAEAGRRIRQFGFCELEGAA